MNKLHVEINPVTNYVFHMLSVAGLGYDNDYGRKWRHTVPENDLAVLTRFMPISARFISNRASYQFKHQEIDTLLKKLSEVTKP